jgi:hypothetical protein
MLAENLTGTGSDAASGAVRTSSGRFIVGKIVGVWPMGAPERHRRVDFDLR